jgi:uncharacterized membrane protein YphA (DoxX/SURF4 family)
MLPSSRSYAFWLGLFRIFLGAVWLIHAFPKFTQQDMFLPPNGFIAKFVADAVSGTTGPYHAFLANVVTPNIGLFAQAVRLGEALVGISLVLGLLSRLGGLGGMFLAANYMLAQGEPTKLSGWAGLDGLVFAASMVNVVLPTGRALGFDGLINRAKAKAPVPVAAAPGAPTAATAAGTPVKAEFVEEKPPATPPTVPPSS